MNSVNTFFRDLAFIHLNLLINSQLTIVLFFLALLHQTFVFLFTFNFNYTLIVYISDI